MAAWPSSLPHPLLSGYSGQSGASFIRSEFAKGPARQRQTSVSSPETVQAAWFFTQAQMIAFKSFWANDIFQGSSWFTTNLDIGAGLQACEARFIDVYDFTLLTKGKYRVNGKLEVRLP